MIQRIIGEQIEKIKQLSPVKFLNSEFGKKKDILEKQGHTESALKLYKDELNYERAKEEKRKRRI